MVDMLVLNLMACVKRFLHALSKKTSQKSSLDFEDKQFSSQ